MEHRHLDLPLLHPSVAAVESILERGGASDIRALLRALAQAPNGPLAAAAETAARHSEVYGYPRLVLLCLDRFREDAGDVARDRR